MKKINSLAGSVFVLVCIVVLCVGTACAMPYVSERFKTKTITISSTFNVGFGATTYDACNALGLKSYTLYTSTGTSVFSATPESYTSGSVFKTSVNLSSYVEKGKSYYIQATFYADGETKTVTSSPRTY